MTKYVLLDRDGVINQDSENFIKSPDEWCALPRSLEAIALFTQHGFQVVVITNQSGLARGLFNAQTLNAIHQKMCNAVEKQGGKIEAIYFCPHQSQDSCECRKPKAGLLKRFSADYHANLSKVAFIGDSLRDIQAAQSVNATPILVKTGNGLKTLHNNPNFLTSLSIFEDLYDAANFLINRQPS